jgi:hypothetical protein
VRLLDLKGELLQHRIAGLSLVAGPDRSPARSGFRLGGPDPEVLRMRMASGEPRKGVQLDDACQKVCVAAIRLRHLRLVAVLPSDAQILRAG